MGFKKKFEYLEEQVDQFEGGCVIKVPLKWSFRDYKHVQWELTVGYKCKAGWFTNFARVAGFSVSGNYKYHVATNAAVFEEK